MDATTAFHLSEDGEDPTGFMSAPDVLFCRKCETDVEPEIPEDVE